MIVAAKKQKIMPDFTVAFFKIFAEFFCAHELKTAWDECTL